MSVYHSSFTYLGINSSTDKKWIIAHFDPDSGETDSYLTKEQVYSDSYDGTRRILYGNKYSTVATPVITVLKQDGSDFSLEDLRQAYKWLTGNPSSSWMDFYMGDEVKYRLLCTIQDVKPYKMDARTVGLSIYCESLSPWAYSPLQTVSQVLTGEETIYINNQSDDLYTYTHLNTVYENTGGDSLKIVNKTLNDETTEIYHGLAVNEIVTLSDGMTITSDKDGKVFGNSFSFTFPRLKAGVNELVITGQGNITFEYIYCIKMGDMAVTLNAMSDPICDDSGDIVIEKLDWKRISNTPTTLAGYGITDAYTKIQVDEKINEEIDEKLNNVSAKSVAWNDITDKPTDLEGYGLKEEVSTLLSSIEVNIDEEALNTMLEEVLV